MASPGLKGTVMVVRDSRVLEFDADAIRDAVVRAGRKAPAPGGGAETIVRVDFSPDRQEIAVWYLAGGHQRSWVLTSEKICALLIAYCAAIRLPMPRWTVKRVSVVPDGVRMAMSHDVADSNAGTVKPMHPLTAQGRAVAWD